MRLQFNVSPAGRITPTVLERDPPTNLLVASDSGVFKGQATRAHFSSHITSGFFIAVIGLLILKLIIPILLLVG